MGRPPGSPNKSIRELEAEKLLIETKIRLKKAQEKNKRKPK
jgi:hypothetical protein